MNSLRVAKIRMKEKIANIGDRVLFTCGSSGLDIQPSDLSPVRMIKMSSLFVVSSLSQGYIQFPKLTIFTTQLNISPKNSLEVSPERSMYVCILYGFKLEFFYLV